MGVVLVSGGCLLVIAGALRQIFSSLEMEHRIFSHHLFISIIMLYTIVLIGFGMVYFVLVEEGISVYREDLYGESLNWVHEMARSLYFSGVTLFTVGYGDLIPVGIGRWIAIIEAMVGYSLPAALVAKVWMNYKEES